MLSERREDNTMDGLSFDEIKKQIRDAIQMDYIEPADIPAIELYMDQVTTFMDKHLSNNKRTPHDQQLHEESSSATTGEEEIFQGAYHSSDLYLLSEEFPVHWRYPEITGSDD